MSQPRRSFITRKGTSLNSFRRSREGSVSLRLVTPPSAALVSTLGPTPSSFRVVSMLVQSSYIHTAICTVQKALPLQFTLHCRLSYAVQPSHAKSATIPSTYHLRLVHSFKQLISTHTHAPHVWTISKPSSPLYHHLFSHIISAPHFLMSPSIRSGHFVHIP